MPCNVSSDASHLGLCGSPVLICAAHVDAVVAARLAVAGIAVCAEHAADDVPKVGHIVDIGQSAGDENIFWHLQCKASGGRDATVAR